MTKAERRQMTMTPLKVLITDGSAKHTLAAVRSLGARGIHVGVVDDSILAQSFYSKYCKKRHHLRWNRQNPKDYLLQLRRILKREKYDVILPVSWYSNYYISKYQDLFDGLVNLAIASNESMEVAANKDQTMEFAEKIGIPIPRTFSIESENDLEKIMAETEFPLVIKTAIEAGSVRYAFSPEELLASYRKLRDARPITQEYIEGYGCGFFAVYDRGTCVAQFMHRRVREYPLSGGPSSAAEAYRSEILRSQGLNILDKLNWHGPAMVEFKRSKKDGKYYLMEINPKLWGSLELAIHAGVDVPFLITMVALNRKFPYSQEFNVEAKFRWPFPGDLLTAIDSREMMRFFRDFLKTDYDDDIRLSDPVPLLFQMLSTIRKLRRKG